MTAKVDAKDRRQDERSLALLQSTGTSTLSLFQRGSSTKAWAWGQSSAACLGQLVEARLTSDAPELVVS